MILKIKEFKAHLKGMSDEQCRAFAVRSAMRALPLLSANKKTYSQSFWFWHTNDRAKYLLAVYLAYIYSIERVLDEHSDVSSSAKVAKATYRANAAAAYAADTAFATSTSVAEYHRSAFLFAASAAADAFAATSTHFPRYHESFPGDDVFNQELKADLAALKDVSVDELLMRPLWSNPPPFVWQQYFEDFKRDALSLNAGFELWLDWYEDRLQGKPIDIDVLKYWNRLPDEIASQGAGAVNAYLKNILNNIASQPLNKVRAIFIGYGDAGKTSLIRALHGEEVVEGKEPMTPGIQIRDWPVPGSDIQAHFWDFGGQVIAHATHQFFLRSSCLYVLVLNARGEINSTEQAEYWLEHVKSFGKSAPVMIVGNKADQISVDLDMRYLKLKYDNIVDFYPVSCTNAQSNFKAEFDRFKRDFCQKLQKVGTHQVMFTKEQFAVLTDLRLYSYKASFLTHNEFEEICTKHGISTVGVQNRDWLLDILDKLGVVIHFPQLPFLDAYVLNPRWLTYGVYTLMYSKKARLTEAEIINILGQQQLTDEEGNQLNYPKDKCIFIMKAMQQFKLCYPLQYPLDTLIIPELLPTDQPDNIAFKKSNALAFEFVFRGFLPRHVMPELIVNRNEEIEHQIVWQRGVLLKHSTYQAQALMQVDYHERVLSIWVQGRDAKDYLHLLNDEVLKILKRLDLEYKEWIELPVSARFARETRNSVEEKAPYRQILAYAANGKWSYISESGLKYDLKKVFGIILSEDEKIKMGIHIYNGDYVEEKNMSGQEIRIGDHNNILGAVIAADRIENSFNSLQASKATSEIKDLLEQLLNEIRDLNGKVPNSESQQLNDMLEGSETLIKETGREIPRKKWYETSLEGIKEAALTVGIIAKPVLEITEKLATLLLD